MPAIGIDLGTTNCCVAVIRGGRAEVIANNNGNRTTPSVVAFADKETLYGEPALSQLFRNSQNTVYEIKRLIGRTYPECKEQIDLEQFPFNVSANDDNMPEITVELRGQQTKYTPQQLSAMLLTQMKKVAEALLDERVTDAVITVPANFNNNQREATKEAAELAGLNVLRLVNEPTAAALAYGLERDLSRRTRILIFDVGGGTFDVSILTAENGDYKVLSTAGDTKLGGADFVNRMVKDFTNKILVKHGKDLNESWRSRMRLRRKCEKAKCDLSFTEEAHIEMDDLMEGVHLDTTVRRSDFDRLNADLFDRTLHIVKHALDDAKLTKNDIDHIVLVGGSTRIVKLRTMLQAFFGGKELKHSINPDEAVACGAALLAANLSGAQIDSSKNIRLADVIPLSLGLDNAQDMMVTVVPRNTPVPFEAKCEFAAASDNHTSPYFQILEGERTRAKDNRTIGSIGVKLNKPRQYGEPTVTVKFNVDANGILKVTVIDRWTGEIIHTNNITDNGRLSQKEIQNMISTAENERETDQLYREQAKAKRELTEHVYQIKHQLEDGKLCRRESDRKKILDHCNELIEWLNNEELKNVSQYQSKKKQFDKLCASMK